MNNEIETINVEEKIKKLESIVTPKGKAFLNTRIDILERTLHSWKKWFISAISLLGIFGITVSGIFVWWFYQLKNMGETIHSDYIKLQKEYQNSQKDIVVLNTKITEINGDIAIQYKNLSNLCLDLQKIANQANSDATIALNKAGILNVAVLNAQQSASKSDATLKEISVMFEEIKKISNETRNSTQGLIDTQRAIESFLSKKVHTEEIKQFSTMISCLAGSFTFVEGESIPYSRRFYGSGTSATIVVPPQTVCIVKMTGTGNSIRIQKKLEGRVIVEASGLACSVSYFE